MGAWVKVMKYRSTALACTSILGGLVALGCSQPTPSAAAEMIEVPAQGRVAPGPLINVGPLPGTKESSYAKLSTFVIRDRPAKVYLYYNVDVSCAVLSYKITITSGPAHGRATVTRAAVPERILRNLFRPLPVRDDPRSLCAVSEPMGLSVDYTPDAGFVGRDLIQFDVADHEFTKSVTLSISVR